MDEVTSGGLLNLCKADLADLTADGALSDLSTALDRVLAPGTDLYNGFNNSI
jgi:hypothetical protein